MKTTTYKVGMLVEHPIRPQWGPGKVIAVSDDRVHVYFRDALEKKAKSLMREHVALKVADTQTDAVLDILPEATQEDGNWMLPKNYEKLMAKAAK